MRCAKPVSLTLSRSLRLCVSASVCVCVCADHRVNVRVPLSAVLEDDGLSVVITALRQADNMQRLLDVLEMHKAAAAGGDN